MVRSLLTQSYSSKCTLGISHNRMETINWIIKNVDKFDLTQPALRLHVSDDCSARIECLSALFWPYVHFHYLIQEIN